MSRDRLRKLQVYTGLGRPYWSLHRAAGGYDQRVRPYPIDFESHLRAGHYNQRDRDGLPIRITRSGTAIRNYTRLCGFAIAQLQAYQRTSDDHRLAEALACADYMERSGTRDGGGLYLRADVPGKGHQGSISAMSQGLAMSVFTRLFTATGDHRHMDSARQLMPPFFAAVPDGGVRAELGNGGCGCVWFEEDVATPLRHILNGMIFALWGLDDLATTASDPAAEAEYRLGLRSLVHHIDEFDTGWWSLYDVADSGSSRLASANYHQLHAGQLAALGDAEGESSLLEMAERFDRYLSLPGHRLRAAVALATSKRG